MLVSRAFPRLTSCVCSGAQVSRRTLCSRRTTASKYITLAFKVSAGGIAVAVICNRAFTKYSREPVCAASKKDDEDNDESGSPFNTKESRFIDFASYEYNGQLYMSPHDFLECMSREFPKHLGPGERTVITSEAQIQKLLKATPNRSTSGVKNLFRDLGLSGIVSFTEYLFLLCVITRSTTELRLPVLHLIPVVCWLMMTLLSLSNNIPALREWIQALIVLRKGILSSGGIDSVDSTLEQIFGKRRSKEKENEKPATSESDPPKDLEDVKEFLKIQETTLSRYLFGPDGKKTITYQDFYTFSSNLQNEILGMEFEEYSGKSNVISEKDFAKILLRYSVVRKADYDDYLNRLNERITNPKGITFIDFRDFCRFLNNLDDFSIAVKLYTMANKSISQSEFARAVKISTGFELDEHVVNTVFQLFDVDNDGQLSYGEFIAVMKNRVQRGLKDQIPPTGHWNTFLKCVKNEMKTY